MVNKEISYFLIVKVIKKNRKEKDCCIVALFNALSWCKKPREYREIEQIAETKYAYTGELGFQSEYFETFLEDLGIPNKKCDESYLYDIQAELHMGKAYLFCFTLHTWDNWHMTMVSKDRLGKIRIINPGMNKTSWDEVASTIYAGAGMWTAWELPNRNTL